MPCGCSARISVDFTPGSNKIDLSGFNLRFSELSITTGAGNSTIFLPGETLVVIGDTTLQSSDFLNIVPEGTFSGTPGNDLLIGGNFTDVISGLAGDDRIGGGGGDDTLSGNNGNDTLYGGNGNDFAGGASGDDTVYGGDGNDTVQGDDGSDKLYGDIGDGTYLGSNGDDTLVSGPGNDTFFGGNGTDTLDYTNSAVGEDIHLDLGIATGEGNDVIGSDIEVFLGSNLADTFVGSTGNDLFFAGGGNGNDFVGGAEDNDALFGGDGNDVLFGGGNDDTFNGSRSVLRRQRQRCGHWQRRLRHSLRRCRR